MSTPAYYIEALKAIEAPVNMYYLVSPLIAAADDVGKSCGNVKGYHIVGMGT